ncbi:MAG: hypothetical protein BWX70_03340 [Verrucomicrobia bacterium ADurb.Bin070]|nr:MAG: hypothetical protein BWX70_03340 [Verrucomicrobia bacterium ADurb.Bin070]
MASARSASYLARVQARSAGSAEAASSFSTARQKTRAVTGCFRKVRIVGSSVGNVASEGLIGSVSGRFAPKETSRSQAMSCQPAALS